MKNLGEKEAWATGVSRDCPNFLSAPIILGMGNLKFCTHIHRIDRYKSPLKISAKVAVGVLRALENSHGTQGASRGHLCGSL